MKNKLKLYTLLIALLPGLAPGKIKGNYNAATLTGDFKYSSELKRFINRMNSKHGLNVTYLNGLFSKAKNLPKTLRIINRPIKTTGVSKGSWNRYKNSYITNAKINKAVKFYRQNLNSLKRAEKKYRIPAEYIVAIMSMETGFGSFVGKTRILDALTTLSFGKNRRQDYFKKELEEFLLMCKKQNLNPVSLRGSYAGAMGLGQFMPSSFRKYAVDFDKNGKKDLWNKTDMIGSIGNYFKHHNWQDGKTVAIKAKASGNKFKTIDYGWRYEYSQDKLKSLGITPQTAIKINSSKLYFIKLVTYKGHELWLGGHNFFVLTRYNNSSKYALTAFLLAGNIKNKI